MIAHSPTRFSLNLLSAGWQQGMPRTFRFGCPPSPLQALEISWRVARRPHQNGQLVAVRGEIKTSDGCRSCGDWPSGSKL